MADIRIKDLATTAASTASDDFIAVDGSANGTRKLDAYSPTFGGNLTVSGTGTSTISGNLDLKKDLLIYGSNASSSGGITANSAAGGLYFYGQGTSTGMRFYTTDGSAASQLVLSLESTKQATFEGNLVVAGTGASRIGGSTAASLGINGAPSVGKLHVFGTQTDSSQTLARFEGTNAAGEIKAFDVRIIAGTPEVLLTTNAVGADPSLGFSCAGYSAQVSLLLNGNFLVGTTIDSSNGKLQLATHTTSAGGIGFGADISLYRTASGRMAIDHLGANDAILFWANSGTVRALGEADGSTTTFKIGSLSAGWSTAIVSGNNATAITLDSSQRCILNGTLRLNNAYTAGAPTATGYVVIEDSAGNTYKVLVGT